MKGRKQLKLMLKTPRDIHSSLSKFTQNLKPLNLQIFDSIQGDTGLQYLTRYQATPIHTEIYQRLLADAVIHPFDISQIHNSRPDSKKYDHYVATEVRLKFLNEF